MLTISTAGKICFRCERESDSHRRIFQLVGQSEAFCERCVFDLLKLVCIAEKEDLSVGELD